MNRSIKYQPADLARSTGSLLKYRWQIAKVPLCLLVSLSTLFGFLLVAHNLTPRAVLTFLGVLLLACGAASLNSYQEYRCDRLMRRTRDRPLARGILSPDPALLQARILLSLGFCFLAAAGESLAPVIAGIGAVVLYNFIYTPLKYRTTWALIPGALCGALPPLIGWLAAGGSATSPVLLAIIALLIVWQVPHFWLVTLENRNDYMNGVIPSLINIFPERNLRYVSVVWVGALVTIIHLLLALLDWQPLGIRIPISLTSMILMAFFSIKMCMRERPDYRLIFILLNIFMLWVMVLFSIGSLLGS